MAQRDRSQGFAFVYVDVAKLLKENTKVREDSPVLIPEDTQAVRVPKSSRSMSNAPKDSPAVQQIQENLDRLSVLHHKLHAMLDELNQITGKKKN
jgi:hypothetical protein